MQSPTQPEDILAASYQHGSSYVPHDRAAQRFDTFLYGYPIHHSLAPLLHSTLFKGLSLPWTYELMETPDAALFLPALKRPNVIGCAVTMPFKVSMMPLVDDVTEEGRMIGAINTVFLRRAPDGSTRYIGTNTDCIGVRESFLQNVPDVLRHSAGRPGLVIGGGGACRASVYTLWKWFGVSRIYMVNRLESEVVAVIESFKAAGFTGELVWVGSVEEAERLEAPALIVATVPDFPPKEAGEVRAHRITTTFLDKAQKGYALEMCYHPKPQTAFFEQATRAGWLVLPGTEAMIYQGVAQEVLWAELPLEKFPVDEAKRVIADVLAKTS